MWEQEQLLSLWGKGKGWSHRWQLLNTLLQPEMAKILIAPGVYDSEDTDSQEKGQSNLSRPGGCVRRPSCNVPASTKDRWDNQNPKKESRCRG